MGMARHRYDQRRRRVRQQPTVKPLENDVGWIQAPEGAKEKPPCYGTNLSPLPVLLRS
jgi:hypothetical protein